MANQFGGLVVDVPGAVQRGLQFQQAAQLRPGQLQQQQLGTQRAEQQLVTSGLQQQQIQQGIETEAQRAKSQNLFNTVARLRSLPDDQKQPFVEQTIRDIESRPDGDATESRQALDLIKQGRFEELNTSLDNLHKVGVQTGFLKSGTAGAIKPTASQQDFKTFQRLQAIADESGKTEDQQAADQFGKQSGFVRPTPQQEADIKISTAKKIAEQKALLEGKSAAVKAAINKGAKAFDQIAPLSTAIANYDDAIAQLDAGANTGFFASMAPSFKAASIRLDNVVKRLGLDVVGSTTFGALSESELKFALSAAIPDTLQPAELKEWLIAKRDAQKKVKARVEEAATFLSDGTHTLSDWIEFDKARQLNIKKQQDQLPTESVSQSTPGATPPSAAQELTEGDIIRNTQTGQRMRVVNGQLVEI